MPFSLIRENPNEPKYQIRFRGAAMIPRINQMAPCRVELTMRAITDVLESLYRHPLRLEVLYVDPNKREWEINFMNYKKILPANPVPAAEMEQETEDEYNPFSPPVESKVEVQNEILPMNDSEDSNDSTEEDNMTDNSACKDISSQNTFPNSMSQQIDDSIIHKASQMMQDGIPTAEVAKEIGELEVEDVQEEKPTVPTNQQNKQYNPNYKKPNKKHHR